MSMIICEQNRYEYEREYVSLILNKEDIIPILQLDYTFLHDPENQKIMKIARDMYLIENGNGKNNYHYVNNLFLNSTKKTT